MRLPHPIITLCQIAALCACTVPQGDEPEGRSAPKRALAEVEAPPPPMAPFARLVGGAWRTTFTSGVSAYGTWRWGPGQHSIVTDGLEVLYWHPGRKQVCSLTLGFYARGVGEGTFQFDGENAQGRSDLYQTGGLRKLATRWDFDGPDQYHDTLLEDTGAGFGVLAEWDRIRVTASPATRVDGVDGVEPTPPPLEHMRAFEPLVGAWEFQGKAAGTWAAGDALHVATTFARIPGIVDAITARVMTGSIDAITARVVATSENGEPTHLLDAYLYHHTGTGALRCLALSKQGGVYEGDVTVLAGGALQIDLKGYEDDQVVAHVVRFDFEKDGTLRQRVWSIEGADRELMLDVRHAKLHRADGNSGH